MDSATNMKCQDGQNMRSDVQGLVRTPAVSESEDNGTARKKGRCLLAGQRGAAKYIESKLKPVNEPQRCQLSPAWCVRHGPP